MSASGYSAKIDLEQTNSSHSLAILGLAPGELVLDIGTADGSVARVVAERGCRVVGIEVDPVAAAAAEVVCERMIVADVERLDLAEALAEYQFDAVLLLDVLEHLRDPLRVLTEAAACLRPGGRVIISVPNVTHAAVRLQLLAGRFSYTEKGLLDKTHLRFFDRSSLEQLLARSGLTVRERLRTTAKLTETEIELDLAAYPADVIELALADEDAETYQFVYVLSAPGGANHPQPGLNEALQRRALEAERQLEAAGAWTRDLVGQIETLQRERERVAELELEGRERAQSLEQELRDRMLELEGLYRELDRVRQDVAIKDGRLAELRAEVAPLKAGLEHLSGAVERHRVIQRTAAVTERFPPIHRLLRRLAQVFGNRL